MNVPKHALAFVVKSATGGLSTALLIAFLAACSATTRGKSEKQPERQAALPASCSIPDARESLATEPEVNPLVTFDTAWSIIANTHWDTTYNGVNWLAVREELRPIAAKAQTRGELRSIIGDMLGRLDQSHFSVIPAETSEPQLRSNSGPADSVSQASGWRGFTFRYVRNAILITDVSRNGPAWQAGVRPGWELEAVRGCPVKQVLASIPQHHDPRQKALKSFKAVTELLDQPVGKPLPLAFRASGKRRVEVSITPTSPPGTVTQLGNLPPMVTLLAWERLTVSGRTIGVIRFNIWMTVLSSQFDAAIDSLRHSDAIVLDLRGNLGGVAAMVSGIAGHFIDTAVVMGTMQQRKATLKFTVNPRRVNTRSERVEPFGGPVALLVDELSGSTTEIFASGLQALGRARVFGSQTAGQALPAIADRLPNGDILLHAVADFHGPTGLAVEGTGVIPDVVTPLSRESLLRGHDQPLEAALEWLTKLAPRNKEHQKP